MRARSIALLILALGCGLVASIGITQVIGNRATEPAVPTGDGTPIFVVLEEVPFGERLSAQVLRLENWPKDKVPGGALSRIEDIEGRRPRTKLYAGEPVLENKLFPKGASEQGYSTVIPKGYRVVAVKVDRVSGSGLILPGDRVDVLVHLIRNPARGILKTSTRTILQDVKVFAVNDVVETQGQDEKKITAQTISLLVTPEHAQLIMLAEELGKIRLTMRSPEDNEVAKVLDTTPSELLDASTAESPRDEEARAASDANQSSAGGSGFLTFLDQLRAKRAGQEDAAIPPRLVPGHTVHRMRLVSGSEVKDVVLEKEAGQPDSTGVQWWKLSESTPVSNSIRPGGVPEPAEPVAKGKQGPAGTPEKQDPAGKQENQDPAGAGKRQPQPQEAND